MKKWKIKGNDQDVTHIGINRVCLPIQEWLGCVMIVTRLNHTRYRVSNLERTIRFYKDVLGLQEVRRSKSPRGSELVFLKAPESDELIEICFFPASGPVNVQADLTHLAFEVASLEEFGRHLASLGLKFSDGPTLRPGGGGFAFIDAPEGYEIELIEQPTNKELAS
jgi:lactoylglutathione lyase